MCNIARVHEQLLCFPYRSCVQLHAAAWHGAELAVAKHAAASSTIQLLGYDTPAAAQAGHCTVTLAWSMLLRTFHLRAASWLAWKSTFNSSGASATTTAITRS
jgi:hypothetical protein